MFLTQSQVLFRGLIKYVEFNFLFYLTDGFTGWGRGGGGGAQPL